MSEFEWLDNFGDNLRSWLDDIHMSRKELAEATGITEASISRYINKQRVPTIFVLIKLANALDCTLDDLADFGDTIE